MPSNRGAISLGTNCNRHNPRVPGRARRRETGKSSAESRGHFGLSTVLQIVPRIPGGIDGVGDYALTIAKKLREKFGYDTVFATFKTSPRETAAGFEVLPLDHLLDQPSRKYDHVLLHYVNYGF